MTTQTFAAVPLREHLEEAFSLAIYRRGRQRGLDRARHLDESQLRESTRRLHRLRYECGCSAGAICMGIGIVVAAAYSIHHGAASVSAGLNLVAVSLGLVLGSTSVGKLAAIAVSRIRWRIESRNLLRPVENVKGADDVH